MNLDGETIDALGYGLAFDPWRFAVHDVDLRAADAMRKREERAERTAADRKAVNDYNRAARARRKAERERQRQARRLQLQRERRAAMDPEAIRERNRRDQRARRERLKAARRAS